MEIVIDKSDWNLVKLGDVAFEYSKRISNPSESEFDRFVGSNNIAQWDFRVKTWDSTNSVTSAMKLFEPNDYLLVRRSLYASDFRERAPRANFSGVCSGDILTIKENLQYIADGYLIGVLNSLSLWKFIVANASGSITRRIKWKDLSNFEFLLPPKEQQIELTKMVWSIQQVIDKEQAMLEKTNDLLCSIYKKFRNNKDGWTKLKIKDLMTFNYGKSLNGPDRIEGEYSVVSSSGIQGTHNVYICDGPGIVVGRKGNVGEVTWVDGNFWVIDTAYYITIKEEYLSIPLKFFYYLLQSANLKKLSVATAVPGLNRDDAILTNVFLPSEKEIEEYLLYFESISNQIVHIKNKIKSSKALKKSLIIQAF
jgi:type I restriction enzyme S subunit